jgi:8-oxo-dGTP pyrophosphatase MutT (NUDIX family)
MKHVATKGLLGELADISGSLFTRPFGEQYAALCYRRSAKTNEIEVLLVTSRDTGRWIIPKGWPMKGKKPHRAAAIEAWEEAGVNGKVRKKAFGYYTYLKGTKSQPIPVAAAVYLLRVETLDDGFREVGQRKREWVSCDEAARRVREPELKTLLLGLPAKLGKPSKSEVSLKYAPTETL